MSKQPPKPTSPRYTKAEQQAEEEIDRYLKAFNARSFNIMAELMRSAS